MPAKKTLTTAGRPPIPIADLERRYCNAPAGEADQLRFPADFMFQLSNEEADALVSQNVISSRRGFGGSPPYAFTREGVAMLSSVLRNERAVAVNIAIMRAFVKLREVMSTHRDLAHKIEALERKYAEHDEEIQVIFKAIKKLLELPAVPPKRPIGFQPHEGKR